MVILLVSLSTSFFVASFLLLKCNWSPCLISVRGNLAPSTFSHQVIHDHSYGRIMPSLRTTDTYEKSSVNIRHATQMCIHTIIPSGLLCTRPCANRVDTPFPWTQPSNMDNILLGWLLPLLTSFHSKARNLCLAEIYLNVKDR